MTNMMSLSKILVKVNVDSRQQRQYSAFSHMRLRKPTGSPVLDCLIRDGNLTQGIHALPVK